MLMQLFLGDESFFVLLMFAMFVPMKYCYRLHHLITCDWLWIIRY
jgi:hypothetical protein